MSDSRDADSEGPDQELISRVRVIEGQPLADRAEAYASLHDELVRRLESGPGGESPRP